MKIFQYLIAPFACLVLPRFIKYSYANDISTAKNVKALDYSTKNVLKVTDNTTLAATTNVQTWMTIGSGDISIDLEEALQFQTDTTIPVEMTTEAMSPLNVLSMQDSCAQYGTCEAILENQFLLKGYQYCRCDSACSVFNDCCLDSKFINNFSRQEPTFVCAPLKKDPLDNVNTFKGIYLIDTCPEHMYNTEIRNKCYQNLPEAGAYVSTAGGTVYKNRYCAECNGINEFAMFSLKVTTLKNINNSYSDMAPSRLLQGLLSNPNVAYELVPPEKLKWRSCLYTELVNSNISECTNYIVNPVVEAYTLKAFRNYFCRPSDMVACFVRYMLNAEDVTMYPLSVIFSFSTTYGGECLQGEEMQNGICQAVPLFFNEAVVVTLQLKTSSNVNATVMKQILVSFYYSLSVPSVTIVRFACVNVTRTPHNSTFLVLLTLRLIKPMTSKETLFVKMKIQKLSWKSYINEDITTETTEPSTEHEPMDTIFWEFSEYDSLYSILDSLLVQSSADTTLTLCTDIVVHSFLTDQILTIQKIKCMDNVIYGSQYVTGNQVKSVITYVGSCVSVTALLVSVIVSRKLKLTNSIPGNNIENLSLSLIVSSILFMTGVGARDYQRVCYVIGVALHYLWLVTFAFMSVAVVYVVHNIRKMVANVSGGLVSRAKYGFTALGLVLPILFVLPSVLLDYYDVENFSAMYAGLICFPTGFLPNIIFVTGPIVISVIVNLVFLIVIIVYVTRHTMTMNHVRKSHSFKQGKVYLRICSIAGVFWLTGVLAAVLRSELIDYIFLVLCTLQGFAIAVGNLGTRWVLTGFRKDLK